MNEKKHDRAVTVQAEHKAWTASEVAALTAAYSDITKPVRLTDLANNLGRDRHNVCRKARSLGLTNQRRAKVDERASRPRMFDNAADRAANTSVQRKAWLAQNPHPRGALGLKHTTATRSVLGAKSRAAWSRMTDVQKVQRTRRQAETKIANGTYAMPRQKTTWKAAWREIGGYRKFYRSRWEANYARYLEWLKAQGEIVDWKHEPDVFWFDGVKRGCVSYLPDFRVENKDGSVEYHEVKGWMDAKSKTKIKRMAKYHPKVRLVVIQEKQYNAIKNSVGALTQGWE